MEIALYPGSFDPPHCGHSMVASFVAQWGGVDEVWVMPSGINPLKLENSPKAGDAERLEMCRRAMEGIPGVRVSDFELHLPRPSFTYRTLLALREAYPEHHFRLVIGGDNWHLFSRWRNSEEIIREFGLIIYPRPGFDINPASLPQNVRLLPDAPLMLLSSTFVREAIASGKSPLGFLQKEVSAYIGAHSLYLNS